MLPSVRNLSSARYLVHRSLSRFLLSALKNRSFQYTVDIGAGRSPYRKFINTQKYVMLDIENRTGDSGVIIGDLNKKIPLEDNICDLVVCTEVLEHLKNPANAVSEIFRVLIPEGMLVLTTPMTWPLHEAPNDYFRYTKFGLEFFLREAGFKKIDIMPSSNYTYTLCQLAVTYMRRPVYKPLVILVNLLGLISRKFARNYEMPLGYQVTAFK